MAIDPPFLHRPSRLHEHARPSNFRENAHPLESFICARDRRMAEQCDRRVTIRTARAEGLLTAKLQSIEERAETLPSRTNINWEWRLMPARLEQSLAVTENLREHVRILTHVVGEEWAWRRLRDEMVHKGVCTEPLIEHDEVAVQTSCNHHSEDEWAEEDSSPMGATNEFKINDEVNDEGESSVSSVSKESTKVGQQWTSVKKWWEGDDENTEADIARLDPLQDLSASNTLSVPPNYQERIPRVIMISQPAFSLAPCLTSQSAAITHQMHKANLVMETEPLVTCLAYKIRAARAAALRNC